MPSLLHVVTSAHSWTLKDGTQHPTGFWAGEFIEPHRALLAAGLEVTVTTPGGLQAIVDEVSLSPAMNNEDEALIAEQRAYLEDVGELLDHPVTLETVDAADFDGVFVSGGHGPMQDLVEDPAIGRIVATLVSDPTKIVSAVCHGTGAFLPPETATAAGRSSGVV